MEKWLQHFVYAFLTMDKTLAIVALALLTRESIAVAKTNRGKLSIQLNHTTLSRNQQTKRYKKRKHDTGTLRSRWTPWEAHCRNRNASNA